MLVSLSVLQLCFRKRFRHFPYNTSHWLIHIQRLLYWNWLESKGEGRVMPVEPARWKLHPIEAIQTHETSTLSHRRTRLSECFSFIIHLLIVSLFITPRCAVCVGVTVECGVMRLWALQWGSSDVAAKCIAAADWIMTNRRATELFLVLSTVCT